MANLAVCRICLATGVLMHKIVNSCIHSTFEKLTNISLLKDNGRPQYACYICYNQLKKCQLLINKALKTEELLLQLTNTNNLGNSTLNTVVAFTHDGRTPLSISPIQTLSVPGLVEDVPLKVEDNDNVKEETVKEELEVNGDNDSDDDHHSDPQASDSEDDLPLISISARKSDKLKETTRVRVRKREKRRARGFVGDYAREIILTREKQIEELMQRSTSLNYVNSPMKCELCYKGFVDTRAFDNHRKKHDESAGAYECDICHMRYPSARQMRTHAVTSHARQYQCTQCEHRAHTANQAREHEKWHRGHTYECKLCGHKFRKPTSYLTHMRKRHPSQHACDLCGESFVSKHGLLMHKSKAHSKEEPQISEEPPSTRFCIDCNIQFASRDAWKRHVVSSVRHTLVDDDSVSCVICLREFPTQAARAHHTRQHARETRGDTPRPTHAPQLSCTQCPRLFVNRSKLQAHINRTHLGLKYNKNIVCEVCGKKCTSNASLKYHQRTHTGEKPHQCAACPKRFADKNHLRIHNRTHTGERPYCCGVCGKRFSQKPALNRHYRVHTGAKPYNCQFCAKTFSQSNSMKLHVRTVHLKMPTQKKTAKETTDRVTETEVQVAL